MSRFFEYHLWVTGHKFYKYDFSFDIYHNDLCRNNSVINSKKLSLISQGYYHELVDRFK